MESNKKPVTGPDERLQTVISELDTTVDDFLEKGRFVLMELMEAAAIHTDDTPDIRTRNLSKANTLADITHDYLTQAQSVITSIVLRESKAWTERRGSELAECRLENEGGKADE